MCVICHKPKNVRFPDFDLIDAMWAENPHGAGAMWYDNDGLVHFKKGFMTLKGFKRWVRKNIKWLEEVECALHFRITTHGGTSAGNCHPFVCDMDADPHQLDGKAECILMHNGVLPITPRQKDISDSAELALKVGRFVNPNDALDVVDELVEGNRIITFSIKDGTRTFGDRFVTIDDIDRDLEKYKGLTFSNDHFVDCLLDDGGYGFGYGGYGFRDCNGRLDRFDRTDEGVVCEFMRPKNDEVGNAQKVLPSFIKPFVEGEFPSDPIKWDKKRGYFYNTLTNKPISLVDVDPDSLSGEDYDIYMELIQENCDEFRTRERQMELDSSENDPTLAELAHYYGMTVKEYLAYEGECARSDNGCNTRVK